MRWQSDLEDAINRHNVILGLRRKFKLSHQLGKFLINFFSFLVDGSFLLFGPHGILGVILLCEMRELGRENKKGLVSNTEK